MTKRLDMNIFFTDLDDTLFSTLRKHTVDADLKCEAVLKDGTPISYSNTQQRALRGLMENTANAMIPVTARNMDAFARCGVDNFMFAVCSNGATILHSDGSVDRGWAERIKVALCGVQAKMHAFLSAFKHWAESNSVRAWLVEDNHLGAVYFVAKSNTADEALLAAKARDIKQNLPDWVGKLHCNGNNLALIPHGVSKQLACVYLREKLDETLPEGVFFGAGDSITDWEFMSACDFAIVPAGSQLAGAVVSESAADTAVTDIAIASMPGEPIC